MGKWKNIIIGEKMPDRDDPKYRDRYEKDVEAGRKFARATRIDRLAGHVQRFAEKHRGVFLTIVKGLSLRAGLDPDAADRRAGLAGRHAITRRIRRRP